MPILVRHNGKLYKIPDHVLARSVISKERFEAGLRELEADARRKASPAPTSDGSPLQYRFLDLSKQEFDDV